MIDEDLQDVIRLEKQRGRKRLLDLEARKQQEQLHRDFKKLLQEGTEQDFVAAIRALGLKEPSDEFQNALVVWRSLRRP
ncbi:MAG: hypothetical protein HY651_05495 [Acidobacteria bacterium]|nr:hypothetical protein [Acidobacteriota bacterium]